MSPHLMRIARAATLIATVAVLVAVADVPSADAAPVFASGYSIKRAPISVQPQWQRVRLNGSFTSETAMAPWRGLHNATVEKGPLAQLEAVNQYFNRVRYGTDAAIYGAHDYWASPAEFLARGVGDCEDYSIAKYAALRALGWPAESLLIVVVRDVKQGQGHAVLAAKRDDRWYVLDNRSSRVMTPGDVPFYQPVYAVNENQLLLFKRTLLKREARLPPNAN